MKFALVNPDWSFEGSVYFGCREAHLPLEFGYAKALLDAAGAECRVFDGHLMSLPAARIRRELEAYGPDVLVLTTAPSYLFWRCPPPELRVPRELLQELEGLPALRLAVGPHGSVTPEAVLRKLEVDGVMLGEFEEALPELMRLPLEEIPSLRLRGDAPGRAIPHVAAVEKLPPLLWPGEWVRRHGHHHHRFDAPTMGPGAEMETSRGCPYTCSFCAREAFRGPYRRRPLPTVLEELDGLIRAGIEYVYFIDETFFPDQALLEALAERPVRFGIQTRIDLWTPPLLERLGKAGCVSIEAGVESLSESALLLFDKPSLLPPEEITARLLFARRHVPFVQANLIRSPQDDAPGTALWRGTLREAGVWANDPVPLFPFPGSPAYRRLWGEPDDEAWERAHRHYLECNPYFSDLQDSAPLSLDELERTGEIR